MFYIEWIDPNGSLQGTGISRLYLEVDDKGNVTREVGLDAQGSLVHKCPAEGYRHGTYGLFDLARFEPARLQNDLSREDFEALWNQDLNPGS